MRRVQCGECGKLYDFDQDDFCPRCGAFTLPGRDGGTVRREGINERNHRGSFVHAELHRENRRRQGTALEQGPKKARGRSNGKGQILWWVFLGIIALNILLNLVS